MASTTLDLPDPLGPTTTVTPGSRSRLAVSAKDLNPLIDKFLRNTAIDGTSRPGRARGPQRTLSSGRGPRRPRTGLDTTARCGPNRTVGVRPQVAAASESDGPRGSQTGGAA